MITFRTHRIRLAIPTYGAEMGAAAEAPPRAGKPAEAARKPKTAVLAVPSSQHVADLPGRGNPLCLAIIPLRGLP